MGKTKEETFQVACPDCGAMIVVDASTGLVISHTSAPRKRMFEDLETAAKAMREQDERKESIFRQSVDAEKNKERVSAGTRAAPISQRYKYLHSHFFLCDLRVLRASALGVGSRSYLATAWFANNSNAFTIAEWSHFPPPCD